ncbi:MAG: UvrD-helicase domain-containing protein [Anaerolineaceae bacterium]|nr:UvrD-helicase domain-containing protein [Anaerolineaceae bacterium]
MEDILKILNSQQQAAVAAPSGPLLILAGPGSGKTRVLTYRIAYLVGVMGVPAYHIMAVTFTNKAAKEMGARVNQILGDKSSGIWLGTFHNICGRILRREADLLPVTKDFVIFDADDQESLMKEVVREARLDEKLFRPASVLDAISKAKNDLIDPENFPTHNFKDEQIRKFYIRYQQLLAKNNAMDFDDMLVYTSKLFSEYETVRSTYAHKFEQVLVDEFQDTNLAQYSILRQIASLHHNIYVVGDEDQSIYRWRGADYRNIQRLKNDFPQLQTILLEQNYRSTQMILDAAMALINNNRNRTRKKLFTEADKGERIKLLVSEDDREEADGIVSSISRAINKDKVAPSAFAIMYRTNAQSRLLEESFRREGIAYRLVGAQRFYGRREVRDMIAFLRLIYNPKDEISFKRVVNLPPRGIGGKAIEKLTELALARNLTLGETLLSLARGENNLAEEMGSAGIKLGIFGSMLLEWQECAAKNPVPILFDKVIEDTAYQPYIQDKSEEGQDRWENVMELRLVTTEYEERGLADFLESMALVADQDTLPETQDAPTMLTLHAAKGLEFDQVFIVGLDEMLLPHSRSRDDDEDLAEERRLLYVGITRARKKLTLTRAKRRRSPYGGYEETLPSRFLQDFPDDLLQGSPKSIFGSFSSHSSERRDFSRWETPAFMKQPRIVYDAPKTKFKSGMQVKHPKYGRGVVKSSKLEHGDETVEVYFEGHGLKAVVASLAKMEIL